MIESQGVPDATKGDVMRAADAYEVPEFDALWECERCGHSPFWHRLDDSLNVSPVDPAAEFRCTGVRFDGCDHPGGCSDFVAPPGYDEAIAARA